MYGSSVNTEALIRRQYLLIKLLTTLGPEHKINIFMAGEAVDSTALAHPEWDMDETKSWDEWEKE